MLQTSLRFGIQEAATATLSPKDLRTTVGQQIEQLLADAQDPKVAGQVRAALKNPQSIIEIRAGKQVQTVSPEVPLRELTSVESGELEITISQPHVGG